MPQPPAGRLAPTTSRCCKDCGVEMVVRVRTPGVRASPHSHAGNDRCLRCYNRAFKRGEHRNPEPIPVPADLKRYWRAEELLVEYEFLLSHGGLKTKRQVAERLNVPFATLDRALCRARAYRRTATTRG